ncbi:TPA: hypothetical protein I8Y00_005316 [Citrobacter farmeri]|uniref:Uncharacterized protein n=4 Tax=Citrobacter TaxID=544 RepID=A0AAP9U013_CITFR|nr:MULTISPECIES: hypothetical protein [Enterobacteriaceae]EBS1368602.1 hypothetical protein [Salmonella enterica subsp. enterica serovar Virchow]EHK0948276.1 hypothetical protein [Citrobacter farmeri]EKT9197365.1 hypothetical protein [Citrobacter freundii]EKX4543620.1 hypothetical protein [Citrobacter farmeri]ELE2066291.1 hypothetical protein [Citrobacter freundii]
MKFLKVTLVAVIGICLFPYIRESMSANPRTFAEVTDYYFSGKRTSGSLSIFNCTDDNRIIKKLFVKTNGYLTDDMDIQLGDDLYKCKNTDKKSN